jgi:hypothetical protein
MIAPPTTEMTKLSIPAVDRVLGMIVFEKWFGVEKRPNRVVGMLQMAGDIEMGQRDSRPRFAVACAQRYFNHGSALPFDLLELHSAA